MTMHVITFAASGASAAASAGLVAAANVSHDTALLLIPAAVSSMAAIVGASVAMLSYLKHRNDASALSAHEAHDDRRFDQVERLILAGKRE